MSTPLRTTIVAGAASLLLLLGACSSSESSDSPADPPTTEADDTTTEPDDSTEPDDTTTTEPDDETETDDDAVREGIVDDMAVSLLATYPAVFDDMDMARCVGERFFDVYAEDLEPGDSDAIEAWEPSEEQGLALGDAFTDCGVDLTAFLTETLVQAGLTEDQVRCVVDEFGEERLHRYFGLSFSGADTTEMDEELDRVTVDCR